MPYRIDFSSPLPDLLDRLVSLGALDVEETADGYAALLPDAVPVDRAAQQLGAAGLRVSPAVSRDDGSTWILSPRPTCIGGLLLAPPQHPSGPGILRLVDGPAFGTGLHPTTALCLEWLEQTLPTRTVDRMLDVGTGSGILALAALLHGVPAAVALDIEAEALDVAQENARLNGLDHRLEVSLGGPENVDGSYPLILANIVAAPLMEMALPVVRRIPRGGQLVLSGIPGSVVPDVARVYERLGLQVSGSASRSGWTLLAFSPTW